MVINNSEFSFKVIGIAPGVYVCGAGGTLAHSDGTYTLSGITYNVTVNIKGRIIFDLAKGEVVFGTDFSGKDAGGAAISGPHLSANKYTVTQSGSGATANTIRFGGAEIYDVTLNGINISGSGVNSVTTTSGSILVHAADAVMHVTLRLDGTNTVERLHYYSTSTGSLTITSAAGDGKTSGTLNATSGSDWEAAIGGTDDKDAVKNLIINGGTINAQGRSSAAIGGGGNGTAVITINGGDVTATSSGTGATIGGGGADTGSGGPGTVRIYGGTVTATNNGSGVAIGGGGTNASTITAASGANGKVEIYGGHVNATAETGGIAIGGGSGGNSEGGTAGVADVTISGGIVVANGTRGISGGKNLADNEYAAADVTISGGSYDGNVESLAGFYDSGTGTEYKHTEVILQTAEGVGVSGVAVSKVNGTTMGMGVITDGEGRIYLWLPDSTTFISAVANTNTYSGSVTPGASGILVCGADTGIVFYLDKGDVLIGTETYSGYDASGNSFSVATANVISCTVTQTDSGTATGHIISFTGNNLTASVILDGINTAASSSISIPAADGSIKDITLLLANTNRVKSVLYYTGDDYTRGANTSALTINNANAAAPGELIADGPAQWQAAIGGTDTNSAVTGLTIAGGTVKATGIDSAAIGGGGNGYTEIEISGGTVTATSRGTGATIGGGGGNSDPGGSGSVRITGGTVTATNTGSGVAIGGGGSAKSSGSAGTVTISGGFITASSSSGNAIGGGNTQNVDTTSSIGGIASVAVSGGTIKTGHIGGGYSVDNGYATSNFTVTGGSINCTTSANPTNGSLPVYMTRVTLYDNNAVKAGAAVTSLSVQGLGDGVIYGMNNVKTDENGVIYVGLPQNASAHTALADEKTFTGNVPAGSTGVLSYGTLAFHTIRVSPSSHYSMWLDDACALSFSGVINVTDNADEPESFTFFLKCVADSSVPVAYVPDENGIMVESQTQPIAVDGKTDMYSYTFSGISGDRVVGFITEVNSRKQLALDVSMGDVVIKSDDTGHEVSCGPYSFGGFVGGFYITTSGINSGNNLTVLSGTPDIYLDRLNLTPSGSGIYVAGGTAAITYSGYNNQISSGGAAAISVSAGATLNLSTAVASNSLTLISAATSAIGGAGTVSITLTGGHLSLIPHSSSMQITAANYKYTVTAQTSGTAPYTYTPSAGMLADYQSANTFYTASSVPEVSSTRTTFKACSVSYVEMSGTASVNGSNLEISLGGTPPAAVAVTRNGAALTPDGYTEGVLTINGAEAYGNLIIAEGGRTVTDMTIATQPAKLIYSHGDSLALTGLSVTLTYSDGSTITASYSQLADLGVTVSPQNGQVLYTETHHDRAIKVSCGNLSAATDKLTVRPTVTVIGNPTAGYSVSAGTDGQSGNSYEWKYSSDNGETWLSFDPPQNGQSLAADISTIGKTIKAVVTFVGVFNGKIESAPEAVQPPTFSVTVPLSMTVTVAADGTMTVCNAQTLVITNYSLTDVQVTGVTYEWASTGTGSDLVVAGDMFNNYKQVSATLKLGETATEYSFSGWGSDLFITRDTTADGLIAAMDDQTPGTLALNWSFELGTGNYMKSAIAAGTWVYVATVTYTVAPATP